MWSLRPTFTVLCAWVLGLAAAPVLAQSPGAQVLVKDVKDGDTLVVQTAAGAPLVVRLRQIDAPEICQDWGPQAREALAALAQGKVATLRVQSKDRQGRSVAQLLINEVDVGRLLVENGHAWSLRTRYDQGPLVKQERMAKALSRGLHGQAGAMPPWDFRRRHKPCAAP
jgi:micrococcal nuclease